MNDITPQRLTVVFRNDVDGSHETENLNQYLDDEESEEQPDDQNLDGEESEGKDKKKREEYNTQPPSIKTAR